MTKHAEVKLLIRVGLILHVSVCPASFWKHCLDTSLPAEREQGALEVHFSRDIIYKCVLSMEQNLLIEGFIGQVLLETKHIH